MAPGHWVAIVAGRVEIQDMAGAMVTGCYSRAQIEQIVGAIAAKRESSLYIYQGFSTGKYAGGRFAGVTLHYKDALSGDSVYVVFNAGLTYSRSTPTRKRGTPLPGKRFNVGKNHALTQLWKDLGLTLPAKLSELHKCMGKLATVVVTAERNRGKLVKGSISPANVRPQPSDTSLCDNLSIAPRQECDKPATEVCDKESPETLATVDSQPDSSAGLGSRVKQGNQGAALLSNACPEGQSTEKWLADEIAFQQILKQEYKPFSARIVHARAKAKKKGSGDDQAIPG